MALPHRTLPPSLRHSSVNPSSSSSSTGASPLLLQRISEKRAELENLQQLKALSAGLAQQMETLQEKLSTLSDGAEVVAAVLANWGNVLRAISMASSKLPVPKDGEGEVKENGDEEVKLPVTLVRIPTQQAGVLARRGENAGQE